MASGARGLSRRQKFARVATFCLLTQILKEYSRGVKILFKLRPAVSVKAAPTGRRLREGSD
jgi:hypothetical protein